MPKSYAVVTYRSVSDPEKLAATRSLRFPCNTISRRITSSRSSSAVAYGKPLYGAAKMSFVKKCKRDACGSKAVSAKGKPFYGAATLGR